MKLSLLILFLLLLSSCDSRVCARTEIQRVTHGGYTTLIPAGKSFIPIFHPGYKADEQVCVEWKDSE